MKFYRRLLFTLFAFLLLVIAATVASAQSTAYRLNGNTAANRPATCQSVIPDVFVTTDTAHFYICIGGVWADFGVAGGGGGTFTGPVTVTVTTGTTGTQSLNVATTVGTGSNTIQKSIVGTINGANNNNGQNIAVEGQLSAVGNAGVFNAAVSGLGSVGAAKTMIGVSGLADGSTTAGATVYGGLFQTTGRSAALAAKSVGVVGIGQFNATTGYGGYFAVDNPASTPAYSLPTINGTGSAALVADNKATAADIFRGLNSGSAVFTVNGTGNTTIGGASPITFSNASYQSCTGFTSNASGVLQCTPSDERLKRGFTRFNGGLNVIEKITPETFRWRDDSRYADGGRTHLGLVAQNLQLAHPLLVSSSGDGTLQPEPMALHAVEIESIKELNEKVARLEAQVAELSKKRTTARRRKR